KPHGDGGLDSVSRVREPCRRGPASALLALSGTPTAPRGDSSAAARLGRGRPCGTELAAACPVQPRCRLIRQAMHLQGVATASKSRLPELAGGRMLSKRRCSVKSNNRPPPP